MTTPQVSLSGNLAFTYARKPSHEIGLLDLEVSRNSLKQYFFHLSLNGRKHQLKNGTNGGLLKQIGALSTFFVNLE